MKTNESAQPESAPTRSQSIAQARPEHAKALAPELLIARHPSQVPASLPFHVHFYNPKKRGTWDLYTNDREYAEQFAASRSVYSNPCVVVDRRAV